MSDEERNSILQQHSAFYNGYAIGNIPSGPQPLLQDEGPTDSQGITVNNRGEVSTYKNHLVNEQLEKPKGRITGGSNEEPTKDKEDIDIELPPNDGPDFEEIEPLDLEPNKKDDVREYVADDMDVSYVESAYDFESGGPDQFGDEDMTYSDDSYGMDIESIMSMFDGSITADYEDEVPAYQFDSEGAMDVNLYEKEDLSGDGEVIEMLTCNECGSEMKEGECTECGSSMYEEVDEDLRESFISQKNEIKEMFNRFNKFN